MYGCAWYMCGNGKTSTHVSAHPPCFSLCMGLALSLSLSPSVCVCVRMRCLSIAELHSPDPSGAQENRKPILHDQFTSPVCGDMYQLFVYIQTLHVFMNCLSLPPRCVGGRTLWVSQHSHDLMLLGCQSTCFYPQPGYAYLAETHEYGTIMASALVPP